MSNGVVEEGVFEGIVVLKADGSISVEYKVNPDYISKGQIKYTTDDGGQARFKILDRNVQEIYIDVASPKFVLTPGTAKDATNKVLNGIVKILTLGLELSVANGAVSKSTGGQQGSQELTRRLLFIGNIFGNGFNNEVVPESTNDKLIKPLINLLALKDQVISLANTINVAMFETTNLFGNFFTWWNNFGKDLADKSKVYAFLAAMDGADDFIIKVMKGVISELEIPEPLRPWTQGLMNWYNANLGGITSSLVNEVITKITQFEATQGSVKDATAFAHSGFFAPLIGAIEKQQYDIHTVINYEGPFILHDGYYVNNPNLKRIINIWGTAPNSTLTGQSKYLPNDPNHPFTENDLSKKAVSVGDFGPGFVGFSRYAGPNYIETINIQILGARHNDFSFTEYAVDAAGNELPHTLENELWNRNPYEPERLAREINFKTNIFIRNLYQAAQLEDTTPGKLREFFENTAGVTEDLLTGKWIVDAEKLQYALRYSY